MRTRSTNYSIVFQCPQTPPEFSYSISTHHRRHPPVIDDPLHNPFSPNFRQPDAPRPQEQPIWGPPASFLGPATSASAYRNPMATQVQTRTAPANTPQFPGGLSSHSAQERGEEATVTAALLPFSGEGRTVDEPPASADLSYVTPAPLRTASLLQNAVAGGSNDPVPPYEPPAVPPVGGGDPPDSDDGQPPADAPQGGDGPPQGPGRPPQPNRGPPPGGPPGGPADDGNDSSDSSDSDADDEPDVPQLLSRLLAGLTRTNRRLARTMEAALTRPREGPKARPPEPFDGEDPDKLDNFITQLTLYFGRYQDGFRDDADRVATALTYLKGDAYAYFGDKIAGRPRAETLESRIGSRASAHGRTN
ncbi:hypothetical protein CC2G_003059 [Coprinopsis cinerea AmutBmut pab1-1]|nr:hypothetical protein CC2G_003059 [Coprinopsis cinerea AmutBmut pab1-1]